MCDITSHIWCTPYSQLTLFRYLFSKRTPEGLLIVRNYTWRPWSCMWSCMCNTESTMKTFLEGKTWIRIFKKVSLDLPTYLRLTPRVPQCTYNYVIKKIFCFGICFNINLFESNNKVFGVEKLPHWCNNILRVVK